MPGGGGELSGLLSDALAAHGLIPRGGFAFEPGEEAPAGLSAAPARFVVLVGHAGSSHWRHFLSWRSAQPAGLADPLDTWSKTVIGAVAIQTGARAVFPSDRPYMPFLHWAMRAEGLKTSPLGVLMHPVYGLWHAYRGALLFDDETAAEQLHALIQRVAEPIHLCDLCLGKPCLKSCPVDAYAAEGFDYPGCRAHVRGAHGTDCREKGCRDRNACPESTAYRYPADMQAFHMAAFTKAE